MQQIRLLKTKIRKIPSIFNDEQIPLLWLHSIENPAKLNHFKWEWVLFFLWRKSFCCYHEVCLLKLHIAMQEVCRLINNWTTSINSEMESTNTVISSEFRRREKKCVPYLLKIDRSNFDYCLCYTLHMNNAYAYNCNAKRAPTVEKRDTNWY